MPPVNIEITLVFTNQECIDRLKSLAEVMRDIEEDMPWRDDVKTAMEDLEYLIEHIEVSPA